MSERAEGGVVHVISLGAGRMQLVATPKPDTSLKVLLVEDSLDDAELLRLVLEEQGYRPQIRRVQTRSELQKALDEEGWQVLLCDHVLPSFDALAALEMLKERELDLPFIIVSNAITESVGIEVMRVGAHDFLLKHSLGRLGAVIEREIREANMRAESRRMQQKLLLSDRLASVGMVAAGVAHEINNPLAYVLGNLEFALSRIQAKVSGDGLASDMTEVLEALQHAREGSERIRATTRDLKVFCRTDEAARTTVNVRKVMEVFHQHGLERDPAPRSPGSSLRIGAGHRGQ
ncbi:MAG: response regulator [Polyangiaceae bacterium]